MRESPTPYGRQRQPSFPGRGDGAPRHDAYRGDEQTYYELPAIKASHYGWLIIAYLFVGGISGASQLLATLADLLGGERERQTVRNGRYVALIGSLVSTMLLIADLHVPRRWYKMLRIFRPTSAMSIGSWILTAFGTFSGLAAVAQLFSDVTKRQRWSVLARVAGIPAALAGVGMSIYTGTLLAATNVPLWGAAPRILPALFGASATTTAASTLSLLGLVRGVDPRRYRWLSRLSIIAGAAEFAFDLMMRRQLKQKGVLGPLEEPPFALVHAGGVTGVGIVLPVVLRAWQLIRRQENRSIALLASMATLLGGFALRAVMVLAGNQSALRPKDYFRFTTPEREGRGERT